MSLNVGCKGLLNTIYRAILLARTRGALPGTWSPCAIIWPLRARRYKSHFATYLDAEHKPEIFTQS